MSTNGSASSTEEKYITLTSGSKMPFVGLGLWKAETGLADIVEKAIDLGYRHLDSASDYFNEKQTGEGIERAINKGAVKREDLFITSKLWNTFHAREHVRPALERTLADLRLQNLDLYLIHFPISLEYVDPKERYPSGWAASGDPKDSKLGTASIRETWEAMVSRSVAHGGGGGLSPSYRSSHLCQRVPLCRRSSLPRASCGTSGESLSHILHQHPPQSFHSIRAIAVH